MKVSRGLTRRVLTMTEKKWFASKNASEMLQKSGHRPSDRKGRLVSCSCMRLVWNSLVDERSRRAVEVAELFADGLASEYERKVAEDKVREVGERRLRSSTPFTRTLSRPSRPR